MKLKFTLYIALGAFLFGALPGRAGSLTEQGQLVMAIFGLEKEVVPGGSAEFLDSVASQLKMIYKQKYSNISAEKVDEYVARRMQLFAKMVDPEIPKIAEVLGGKYTANQLRDIVDFLPTAGGKAVYRFAFVVPFGEAVLFKLEPADVVSAANRAQKLRQSAELKYADKALGNYLEGQQKIAIILGKPPVEVMAFILAQKFSVIELTQIAEFLGTDGGQGVLDFFRDAHAADGDLGMKTSDQAAPELRKLEHELLGAP